MIEKEGEWKEEDKTKLIKENLEKLEQGEPLTIPLALLSPEFKNAYREKFGEFERLTEEEKAAKRKLSRICYYSRPESKLKRREYLKEYYKRPGVRERVKIYAQRYKEKNEDKLKQRRKEWAKRYFQNPKNVEKRKERQKEYYLKNKKKISIKNKIRYLLSKQTKV